MGFRFQKRIKIAPGLRLNISKSGASVTTGVRGASVTTGKNGMHLNTGLPGTGLSHRQKLGGSKGSEPKASASSILLGGVILSLIVVIIWALAS